MSFETSPPGQPQSRRSEPAQETLDIRSYIRPAWRWKWLIVAIVAIAVAATYVLTSRERKTYTAAALVYVQDPTPATPQNFPPTIQQLANIATLFTSASISQAVYNDLHLPIGSAGSVVVAPNAVSSFLSVNASSPSPTLAAALANTYVKVFLASQAHTVTVAEDAAANAARTELATVPKKGFTNVAQRQTLIQQIAADEAAALNASPGATLEDPAAVPTAPSSPNPKRDAIFAGILALIVALGIAFLLDLSDRRLRRVSSVESIYGRSVIGVLPHVSNTQPRSDGVVRTPHEFIEVMRSLRVNLRLAAGGRPLRSVIITSALPSEGKSTIVRDLAFACADAGERVLLIDCDLRRPNLSSLFGIEPKVGLAHVLRGEASPGEAAVGVVRMASPSSNGAGHSRRSMGDPRRHGSIDLIAHGERVENPAALLSSQTMTELLAEAGSHYDLTIVDTSPILTVSDAVPLLDQVSSVLFVARLGMTTRDAAARLTELATRIPDMNLVGVVVNDMRDSYGDEGYTSYSRYGYAYGHPEATGDTYAPLLSGDSSSEPASPSNPTT